jgi:toxin-antitoxin system PIN domain toxin
MIALDTNLLIYAHRADNPFHATAAKVVRDLSESRAAWAIPWPCLHEFYGVATNRHVFTPPSTPNEALSQIEIWRESPTLHLLSETPDYWPILRDLIAEARLQGPMVHDARIAALCLSHGVRELWSADRDFSRFPGLRVRNPLLSANGR